MSFLKLSVELKIFSIKSWISEKIQNGHITFNQYTLYIDQDEHFLVAVYSCLYYDNKLRIHDKLTHFP